MVELQDDVGRTTGTDRVQRGPFWEEEACFLLLLVNVIRVKSLFRWVAASYLKEANQRIHKRCFCLLSTEHRNKEENLQVIFLTCFADHYT